MKDTRIPLDIAYVREDKVISEILPLHPYSVKSVVSSEPVLYAVEANSGFFARNGIIPGSRLIMAQLSDDEVLNEGYLDDVPDILPIDESKDKFEPAPKQSPPKQMSNPMPDLMLNMAVIDLVPIANKYNLAIAFDYELPNGNVSSYYMLPLSPYELKPGKNGRTLIVGQCSHAFGDFRSFNVNGILGYDLYEVYGPRAGRLIVPPTPQPPGNNQPSLDKMPTASSSRESLIKKSEYSTSQYMMSEYWDEIAKKRDEGKTEGEAILEYLSENTKRESPRKRKSDES
jgi:hypothetical protein